MNMDSDNNTTLNRRSSTNTSRDRRIVPEEIAMDNSQTSQSLGTTISVWSMSEHERGTDPAMAQDCMSTSTGFSSAIPKDSIPCHQRRRITASKRGQDSAVDLPDDLSYLSCNLPKDSVSLYRKGFAAASTNKRQQHPFKCQENSNNDGSHSQSDDLSYLSDAIMKDSISLRRNRYVARTSSYEDSNNMSYLAMRSSQNHSNICTEMIDHSDNSSVPSYY